MPITDIYRMPGNRTGSKTIDTKTAKERWYVETDVIEEVEFILAQFVNPGGVYLGRRVDSVSAADSSDSLSWLVDVTYSSSASDNPLNDPIMISGNQSARQVPVEFDRDGQPILNTAGDPFQEILFAEDFDDTIQLSFNSATVPFNASQQAKRTVSSNAMLGLSPGTVRYAGMNFQPQDHETLGLYYSISIGLALADDWKTRILNQGFRELDGFEQKVIKIDGQAVTTPALLDQGGEKLDESGQPVTLEFDIYGEANYVALFGLSL